MEKYTIFTKNKKDYHKNKFFPKKWLGQHFLLDENISDKIIKTADLTPNDILIEIGPGKGFLTRSLIKIANHVIAIEIDNDLSQSLPNILGYPDNLTILTQDARDINFSDLMKNQRKYKFMGNLPYYAASPIIRKVLTSKIKPSEIIIMLQLEVAQRMIAKPGNMSLLSVFTQILGNPTIIAKVKPTSFYPRPKVFSAIVRIEVLQKPLISQKQYLPFFNFLKIGFNTPRKQLHNALSNGFNSPSNDIKIILNRCGVDYTQRPASLNLENWFSLYKIFESQIPDMGEDIEIS
jgi:16S rRNA (adenine1518-N6/adenine1519-N6)-dimethyltransferase